MQGAEGVAAAETNTRRSFWMIKCKSNEHNVNTFTTAHQLLSIFLETFENKLINIMKGMLDNLFRTRWQAVAIRFRVRAILARSTLSAHNDLYDTAHSHITSFLYHSYRSGWMYSCIHHRFGYLSLPMCRIQIAQNIRDLCIIMCQSCILPGQTVYSIHNI